MSYTLNTYFANGGSVLAWPTSALHPILMTAAFGLLAPVGAISWRTYEGAMGMDHATVKRLHAVLMTSASVLGALGVLDMWLVHANGATAIAAKGLAVHFQSPHGVVGMLGLVLFVGNWLFGLLVFYGPSATAKLRSGSVGPHAFIGAMALLLCLVSLGTGIVSLAGRGNLSPRDVLFMVAACLVALLIVSLAAVYSTPKPRPARST